MLEGGLWIALVVLSLAGAGISLTNTLRNTFDQVKAKLEVVRPLGIP